MRVYEVMHQRMNFLLIGVLSNAYHTKLLTSVSARTQGVSAPLRERASYSLVCLRLPSLYASVNGWLGAHDTISPLSCAPESGQAAGHTKSPPPAPSTRGARLLG